MVVGINSGPIVANPARAQGGTLLSAADQKSLTREAASRIQSRPIRERNGKFAGLAARSTPARSPNLVNQL